MAKTNFLTIVYMTLRHFKAEYSLDPDYSSKLSTILLLLTLAYLGKRRIWSKKSLAHSGFP